MGSVRSHTLFDTHTRNLSCGPEFYCHIQELAVSEGIKPRRDETQCVVGEQVHGPFTLMGMPAEHAACFGGGTARLRQLIPNCGKS